jgi:hypothetical protein
MPAIPHGDWESNACLTVGELIEALANAPADARVWIANGKPGSVADGAKVVTVQNGGAYIWWDGTRTGRRDDFPPFLLREEEKG